MTAIRVYLLTCRRPELLRRALRSLVAQTFTDWVCEVHNDAPDDDSPARVLSEVANGDARFSYHRHDPALGAVGSFNICFRAAAESYAALLEDDNWWEPALLGRLFASLEASPGAALAWANMRIWRENEDSSWSDTGSTVWPEGASQTAFDWPVALQAFDGLHSNGAMLFRRPSASEGTVPPSTPFAIIEPVRERSLEGPLVFIPDVLANYALTRGTARSRDRTLWAEGQLLLAGSFLEEVPLSLEAWDEMVAKSRDAPGRLNTLILLALSGIRRREITSRLTAADILKFVYSCAGNLRTNMRALAFRKTHFALWDWLRVSTGARTAEARAAGWTSLQAGTLFTKNGYPSGNGVGLLCGSSGQGPI
jgi:hypothetical protein